MNVVTKPASICVTQNFQASLSAYNVLISYKALFLRNSRETPH